ncbi:MAG: DNA topoisomerase VI subunit B [Candidatus Eisenbacteria bacterium]
MTPRKKAEALSAKAQPDLFGAAARKKGSAPEKKRTRRVVPEADPPKKKTRPRPTVETGKLIELPVKAAPPDRVREPAAPKAPRRPKKSPPKPGKQREISVSEFFAKNRHLLGFDNPSKALLTTVKEAVDNSLDACEEAEILPRVEVRIEQLSEDRFRIAVEDNGPGIVKKEAPRIFGSLLYGSKFHRLRQSRGQQGIGISAAGMYGQMTTGKPMVVVSRTGKKATAHRFALLLDTKKNLPVIAEDDEIEWGPEHGTRVEIELEGTYKGGQHSVDRYLRQVALANPHAELLYHAPKGETHRYERSVSDLPPEAKEIKPHPRGVELGTLMKMLKETKARHVSAFLTHEFSRVSGKVADEILAAANLKANTSPARVHRDAAEVLYRAIGKAKIMNPPTNCLSPIGEAQLIASLQSHHEPEFVAAVTRPPTVYRGNPFVIEAALAYGGKSFDADQTAELYRFANRVPLQYQKSACAITKSVIDVAWRSYMVQQSRGALPVAPMAIAVHIASVWVPFTSESKEAIASYPEIQKEIRLALQECGRKLAAHIRRGRRLADAEKKRSYIEKYLPHIGIALQEILGLSDERRDERMTQLEEILERSRKL